MISKKQPIIVYCNDIYFVPISNFLAFEKYSYPYFSLTNKFETQCKLIWWWRFLIHISVFLFSTKAQNPALLFFFTAVCITVCISWLYASYFSDSPHIKLWISIWTRMASFLGRSFVHPLKHVSATRIPWCEWKHSCTIQNYSRDIVNAIRCSQVQLCCVYYSQYLNVFIKNKWNSTPHVTNPCFPYKA